MAREFWINEFGFVITPWSRNYDLADPIKSKVGRLIVSTKPEEGASRFTHVREIIPGEPDYKKRCDKLEISLKATLAALEQEGLIGFASAIRKSLENKE